MRYRSFTLLETLVSLTVISMFISAGMGANRIIRRSTAARTERETMKMLAVDSIRTFEAWRDWYVDANTDLKQETLDDKFGTTDNTKKVTVVLYAKPISCESLDPSCATQKDASVPLSLNLCIINNGSFEFKCTNGITAPLKNSNTGADSRIGIQNKGDFVVVANSALTNNNTLNTIIDVSNPLLLPGRNLTTESINITDPDADPSLTSFAKYRRLITLSRVTQTPTNPTAISPNSAAYLLEVKVTNKQISKPDVSESTLSPEDYHVERSLIFFTK